MAIKKTYIRSHRGARSSNGGEYGYGETVLTNLAGETIASYFWTSADFGDYCPICGRFGCNHYDCRQERDNLNCILDTIKVVKNLEIDETGHEYMSGLGGGCVHCYP